MDGGKCETYFQFPIRAIALGKCVDKVAIHEAESCIGDIMRWCVWDVAQRMEGTSAQRIKEAENTLKITLGRALVSRPELPNGGDALVRIRSDIVWDAYRGELSWRDFAYICGVYCALGDDRFKCIRIGQISALSLGLSTSRRVPKSWSLSRFQASRTLEKLQARGFFTRASIDYRNYFYTIRMTAAELEKAVLDQAVKKCRASQATQTERLRAELLKKLKLPS